MPAPERKISVPAGAATVEIPAEWLHKDQVGETHVTKEFFEQEIRDRLATATKGKYKPEELIALPDFLKTVAEQKKDDLVKLLNIKPAGAGEVDIGKIQTEALDRFRRDELKPVQDSIKTYEDEIGFLRTRDLDAQVAEAVNGRVPPDLLDLVKLYVRERAAYDKDSRGWFVKKLDGGDGFEFSTSTEKGARYMKPKELIDRLQKSGEKKSWFIAGTQAGAGYAGGGGSGNGSNGATTLEQFQKLTPAQQAQLYRDNPENFTKLMGELQSAGEARLFAPTAPPIPK